MYLRRTTPHDRLLHRPRDIQRLTRGGEARRTPRGRIVLSQVSVVAARVAARLGDGALQQVVPALRRREDLVDVLKVPRAARR